MKNFVFGAAILLPLAVSGSVATAGLSDVLDRPALVSEHALRAAMLAVTRSGHRLVAVGERGIALLSDDNGKAWRQARVPVSTTLTQVVFVDEKQGWAAGHSGVLLSTRDGGESWQLRLDGRAVAQLELAAAKQSGDARRIADAERLVADGPDKPFLDLHFDDANKGYAVGAYGLAVRTLDGGATWQSMMGAIDNPKARHYYAVQRVGTDLYLCGEQGLLYRSTDDGASFAALPSPGKGSLFGMASDRGGQLFAYGLRGALFRSVDHGASWDKVEMPPVSLTAGLTLTDGSVLLADERGHLVRSKNGAPGFEALTEAASTPVSGLVQAADGAVIVVGAKNIDRIVIGAEGAGK